MTVDRILLNVFLQRSLYLRNHPEIAGQIKFKFSVQENKLQPLKTSAPNESSVSDSDFLDVVLEQLRLIASRGEEDTSIHDDKASTFAYSEKQMSVLKALQNLEGDQKKRIEEIDNKNKELMHFSYIASHDLQEPLRTITSFSKLLALESKRELSEDGKEYLDFIVQAADRMKLLIQELLDYSRIGKNKSLSMVDCNFIIEHLSVDLAAIISSKGATIEVGDLPEVEGFFLEIRQLFQNLISNALKFSSPEVPPVIRIGVEKTAEAWLFHVADNGIGIADKHKERIFQIFQRLHHKREYEGSGIGLAYCKKIVELHGGKIWVESELNKGAVFYFTIPFEVAQIKSV